MQIEIKLAYFYQSMYIKIRLLCKISKILDNKQIWNIFLNDEKRTKKHVISFEKSLFNKEN